MVRMLLIVSGRIISPFYFFYGIKDNFLLTNFNGSFLLQKIVIFKSYRISQKGGGELSQGKGPAATLKFHWHESKLYLVLFSKGYSSAKPVCYFACAIGRNETGQEGEHFHLQWPVSTSSFHANKQIKRLKNNTIIAVIYIYHIMLIPYVGQRNRLSYVICQRKGFFMCP